MSVATPPRTAITHYRPDIETEAEKRPLNLKLILRLFSYTKTYRARRNWLIFLTITRSIQLPLIAWAVGAIISGPIRGGDMDGLFWGVLGFATLVVSADLLFHFRQRFALELGESVVHDLRNDVFRHLQRMPMAFFNKTKLGRIISRMTSDIESVRVGVQDVFFVSLVQVGQMSMAAVLMLYFDWKLFTVILGMAPILYLINRHFRVKLSIASREVQESFSRVTSTLAESVSGIRVTQGFSRQQVNAGFFRALNADHSRYNMSLARNSARLTPLLELNSQFFIAMLLLLGGYFALGPVPSTSVGDLIQFFFLANLFFSPVLVLGNQYNQALVAMAGAERVFRLLDREPEWQDDPTATPIPQIRGHVEFKDISFAYNPGQIVLDRISFKVEPGQAVALVGHTGSGKSSIINLLAKFYLPSSGELLIDGREIRTVSSVSLHRQMGIVLQQNFLFSTTVLENIRFGRPDASDEEIVSAVRSLDCLDIIAELPGGFSTQVGERGGQLSLGQRQVVCFARALLADPRLLILDEATSSIDTVTEARLQRALERLLAGRTSFVVAHRLSTIRNADLVLVLDHGRIVEQGNHDSLLAQNGVYAGLYQQFSQQVKGDSA